MMDVIIVIILGVLAILASVMGIHSIMREARVEAENERLRRLNDGQRLAIERLQTEKFFGKEGA